MCEDWKSWTQFSAIQWGVYVGFAVCSFFDSLSFTVKKANRGFESIGIVCVRLCVRRQEFRTLCCWIRDIGDQVYFIRVLHQRVSFVRNDDCQSSYPRTSSRKSNPTLSCRRN